MTLANSQDTPVLIRELRDLAEQLKPYDAVAEKRLNRLGDALEHGTAAELWAQRDVSQLFDVPALRERLYRKMTDDLTVFVADLIRNSLIFVPIITTWIAIDGAVKSYATLLAVDPARREEPFLALWQNGFYGNEPAIGLNSAALILILMLVTVIILTIISTYRSNLIERRAEQVIAAWSAQLEDLLVRTADELRRRVRPAFEVATEEIERIGKALIDQLRTERERIDGLSRQRESELINFTAFTDRLETSTANLVTAANSVEQSYRDLAGGLSVLGQAVASLHGTAETISAEVQRLITPVSTLVTEQTTIGDRLAQLMPDVTASVSTAARAADHSAEAAEQIVRDQQQHLQAAADERRKQSELTDRLHAAVRQLDLTAQQFNAGITELKPGIGGLDRRLQELETPLTGLTTQSSSLAGASRQQVVQLEALASAQLQAAERLDQQLKIWQAGDERIAATAAALSAYTERMQQVYDRAVNHRDDILQRLAERLSVDAAFGTEAAQTSVELREVAALLRDTLTQLQDTIEHLASAATLVAAGQAQP